uniref:Venom polypeptide n=1 Tax=Dolopus genitalis TaxID=2488630 RepID=A0A3G5BIG1_DOLGE|nr:venom polypeptide [Dolopus genitalis]
MRFALFFIAAFVLLQCIPQSESKNWLSKRTNKAAEVFKKAVDKIKQKIGFVKNECKAFFKKVKDGIKKSVAKIKSEVEKTGDSAMKVIFKQIYNGLDKARKKLDDVSEIADKKFYSGMEKAHNLFFTVTSQIEKFVEKQKKIVEKKKDKDTGLKIIDDFVIKSSGKVESCSDAALNPVKELYEKTKAIIKGSIDKVEEIIRQTEKCMDMGMKTETLLCARNIGSIATEQLYKMGEEIMELKNKLIGGAVKELLNFVCVGKTRSGVEIDKLTVEKKIKNLK